MLDLGFHSFRGLVEGDPIASMKVAGKLGQADRAGEVLLREMAWAWDCELRRELSTTEL